MEGFRTNESPKILQNEHGDFESYELGDAIKKEGDEIRKENEKIEATLRIIENPAFDPIREDMIAYLNQLHSNFNWDAYVDLVREKHPTLN